MILNVAKKNQGATRHIRYNPSINQLSLTFDHKRNAQSLGVVIAQNVQKLFACGNAGIVRRRGILKIDNDGQILDQIRHQADTALQTIYNMLDLTFAILGVLQSWSHNPDWTTTFIEPVKVHFTCFGLNNRVFRKNLFPEYKPMETI